MSERAAIVVPLPLSVVESNLWDVTTWAAFLPDVEWIERTSHERYVFGVREGRRVHEIPLNVRWHAREHRAVWREIGGPEWRGEIRLTALNGRRTRASLHQTRQPRTLGARLAELVSGKRPQDLATGLARLAEMLEHIPQPLNPARLNQAPRAVGHGAVRAARSADYLSSRGQAGTDAVPMAEVLGAAGGS